MMVLLHISSVFFFNDTATTEIYTLSLHDALPISFEFIQTPRKILQAFDWTHNYREIWTSNITLPEDPDPRWYGWNVQIRSEEHTSELQSQSNLVCRLLLEKKKNTQ